MNRRSDTAYWRDNAANDRLSDSLRAIITCWFTGGDLEAEIAQQGIAGYYAATSWHCLLAGYGQFPEGAPHPAGPSATDMTAVDDFLRRAAPQLRGSSERTRRLGLARRMCDSVLHGRADFSSADGMA